MNDELSPGSGASGAEAAMAAPAGPDTEPQPLDVGPPTAGGLIRAARQAQGIDLASLAAMLKIPLRKLESLESDRHDDLQGPTFERALAQAACRVLKIDPKPVLALMPQVAGNTLEHVTGGLNKPFRERSGRVDLGEGSVFKRPVVAFIVVLGVAAAALFFLPESLWTRASQVVSAMLAGSGPTHPAAQAPAAATTAAVEPAPAASAAVAATPFATPAPATATGNAPTTAAVTTTLVPPAVPAASGVDEVLAHAAPPPNIPLQVTASADSWVEVLDAQGHALLSRTVVAGESVGLDGAMPMRIKVGNARATKLTLRGDNVDLTPYTHDNVARVELK